MMTRVSTLGFVLMYCSLLLLLQFEVSKSAEFVVGDSDGWTYNMEDWPKGKSFEAGDVLVFKYDPQEHNVVRVDADAYDNCIPNSGKSSEFESGNDRITLDKGDNYFICGIYGHCQQTMKVAVKTS